MDKRDLIQDEIRNLLDVNSITYEYQEHEPTPTCEDAANVRGTLMEEGVKALILVSSKSRKNIMIALPGHLRLDSKAIRNYLKEDFSFEKPEIILEKYGLIVGGIPPFGNLLGLEVLIDEKVFETKRSAFNCGKQTCSIIMESSDLKKVIPGIIGQWSK
jgi:nondiscriminating aspartyl-tRNA synthetase